MQHLGPSDETHYDGARIIWFYQAPDFRVTVAISRIPVIGDLTDLIELGRSGDRYETIIEFERQGVLSHTRRRRMQE